MSGFQSVFPFPSQQGLILRQDGGVPRSSPSASIYVGNSGVCWWLLLCESIGSCRLGSIMSSILKFILPDSSINFYLCKSLALKLEHTSELSGGLVETQVARPYPQNLSVGWRWGQEFAFLPRLQIILRQLVKDHNLSSTALDLKPYFVLKYSIKET